MPPIAPLKFSNISPERYVALVHKANEAGLALTGNSGTASKMGVEVAWDYSPELGRLTIQCLTAPFFMNADAIHARIKALVEDTTA